MCFLIVFGIVIVSSYAIFKYLENHGKKVEKTKELVISMISIIFVYILLSAFTYTITRNNADFLKTITIYFIWGILVLSMYYLYVKGYKRIVKFLIAPSTILIIFISLTTVNNMIIGSKSYFVFLLTPYITIALRWLISENKKDNHPKNLIMNILYLSIMIAFTIGFWNIICKDISILKIHCETRVEEYLKHKGYDDKVFFAFANRSLQRGDRELVMVHFDEDPCTYIYEYFYEDDSIKQISVTKKNTYEPLHKEDSAEIIDETSKN